MTPNLTAKQADALVAIHTAPTPLRESNNTGPGTIYWQHVHALQTAGLIEVGADRTLATTPAGAVIVQAIWPNATHLAGLGYQRADRLKLRRWGSGTVHHTPVVPPRFYRATVLGADCLIAVDPPVVAACGARLTGDVIVMEAATKVRCTACRKEVS